MNLLNADPQPYPFGPASVASIFVGSDPLALALVDGERTWTYGELETAVEDRSKDLTERFVFWSAKNSAELVIEFLATQRAGHVWVGLPPTLSRGNRETLMQRVLEAQQLPSNLSAVAFTSGTTGQPKGVMHSQHSMLAPGLVSIDEDPPATDERIGTPLSLCILNMLLLGPVSALLRGSTAVIMERTWDEGFAEDVRTHHVTKAFVVPTMLHDLVHAETITDLAPLRSVIVGGAGINMDVIDAFETRFGVRPVRRWGFTEAPTGVVTDGYPFPHVEIIEIEGELCVRPASSGRWAGSFTGALGYLDDPEATEELFRDGVLHTGDAGSVDANGVVSVTGRLSEMIIRGGANIDPTEVERALLSLDGIADAAVVGMDDARLGQVVAAAICGVSGPDRAAARLQGELPTHAVPERWLLVDELPRNAMGKVDRAAVRQLFHDSTSP
ncbi:MAG: long-chain fatty acid--CoA ligase [Acidimicrobiales bacterium]|nr:long-chain fatty acid--CoA ligase [Acidimicrobiales bacterium]